MRLLVFLLVLANLAFFAWAQGLFGQRDNPDAVRLTQQVAPEKLRVVARDEPPPVESKAAAAATEKAAPADADKPAENGAEKGAQKPGAEGKGAVADQCLSWPVLATADADRLEALLTQRYPDLRHHRRGATPPSWWVFVPPLANRAEAERKASELKRLGVPELFVVQETGPNHFAISLGIFSSEEAAQARLEALRAKGVRSARSARRDGGRGEPQTVDASGAAATLDAAREAAHALLPQAKPAACGNG